MDAITRGQRILNALKVAAGRIPNKGFYGEIRSQALQFIGLYEALLQQGSTHGCQELIDLFWAEVGDSNTPASRDALIGALQQKIEELETLLEIGTDVPPVIGVDPGDCDDEELISLINRYRDLNHHLVDPSSGVYVHTFTDSACTYNIPYFTNASCEAVAAFALSQARLEPGNWDTIINAFTINSDDPVAQADWRESNIPAGIVADPRWRIRLWPFDVGSIVTWILERLPGIGGTGGVERTRGASFGFPNLYPQQVLEAYLFLMQLEANPDAYPNAILQTGVVTALFTNTSDFLFSLQNDPAFSLASVYIVMNWAGARQMINIGAGSQDIPAIRDENFGEASQTRQTGDISFFSVAMVRYSDAVSAEVFGRPDYWNIGEFHKWVSAVEGTDDTAEMMGMNISVCVDYIAYTCDEAPRVFEGLVQLQAAESSESVSKVRNEFWTRNDGANLRTYSLLYDTLQLCADGGCEGYVG